MLKAATQAAAPTGHEDHLVAKQVRAKDAVEVSAHVLAPPCRAVLRLLHTAARAAGCCGQESRAGPQTRTIEKTGISRGAAAFT